MTHLPDKIKEEIMSKRKAVGFLAITMIIFLVTPEEGLAWANCIINRTTEITGTTAGERIYIGGYFGDSSANFKTLDNTNDWICTNDTTTNAGVGLYIQRQGFPPTIVWHKIFTANRTDDNHPYIEVYCGKTIYYSYENNKWKSDNYTWDASTINCK
ncbi:MAG TPA: hypothetical protein DER04_00965 [Holosporales bacterium]|nr:MAG: hypothetical protein A3H46_06725 [Alphaproteobacteria bacterium RIFCSPLOWO2_02_FULL_43_54]HCE95329.1 hypothetical protein [Holosporales bacterium]